MIATCPACDGTGASPASRRTLQILSDLGAQTGSIDERARWCRDHLVHVDAVGVMAAGLAAAESAGDAAHAILLDAIGGLVAGSTHGGDVVGLARIAAHEIAAAWDAIGTPPAGTLAGAIRRIREGDP